MKKGILAISFLCYMTLTCGVVVNLHFCMDRLASVQVFGEKADHCGQCGMAMHEDNDCCHDEVKVIKLEQDQNKTASPDYTIPALSAHAFFSSAYMDAPVLPASYSVAPVVHSPPKLSGQDIYLQISVFRI